MRRYGTLCFVDEAHDASFVFSTQAFVGDMDKVAHQAKVLDSAARSYLH